MNVFEHLLCVFNIKDPILKWSYLFVSEAYILVDL